MHSTMVSVSSYVLVLLCLEGMVPLELSNILALTIFPPPLPYTSLSPEGRGLMKTPIYN